MIAALAGGVGAARFLTGLCALVGPEAVTAVVNTGDDLRMHGLAVSPDLDTVTYTLAGLVDGERGWGRQGETWAAMDALEVLAGAAPAASAAGTTWFRLGDRDLATHLYRTQRLAEGAALSEVTAEVASALGLRCRLLPVTDDPVATRVGTADGELAFQDWFVRRRHGVAVRHLRYEGAAEARPAPGVLDALGRAEAVVICPSNPLCSIAPVLAVPGVTAALAARRASVVAVSPLVAGAALRGPADRVLADLGHEASVVGVARLYAEVAAALVVDTADEARAGEVAAAGVRPVVAPAVMHDRAAARALAAATLAAAGVG